MISKPSCSSYIKGTCTIYFPDGVLNCSLCPLMGAELVTGRKYCRRSGELLTHAEHQIGYDCPLHFEEDNIDDKF